MENSPDFQRALEAAVEKDKQLVRQPETGQAVSMTPLVPKKWEPKRLTPKHKQILSLYAQGMKREEIGSLCKCTPALITMLAVSKSGQEYLKEIDAYMDIELAALAGARNAAIREQLMCGTGENKLKAAKLQMQATGKLGKKDDEAESAEDVISRIMNMQVNGDLNITVNQGAASGPGSVLPTAG